MKASKIWHINTEVFNATERKIPYQGDEFHLIEASQEINVTFYNARNAVITQVNGFTYFSASILEIFGEQFHMVGITSPGGNCTPDFVVAENFRFNALKMSAVVSMQRGTSIVAGARIVSGANNETIAANASRRKLTIRADSANAGNVYTNNANATSGIPLLPGETRTFDSYSGALGLWFATIGDIVWFDEEE